MREMNIVQFESRTKCTKNTAWIYYRKTKIIQKTTKSSKGYNQTEIGKKLQVDSSVICRDVAHIREQAKTKIKKYIDERLPEEYEKCLVGISSILKEAWNRANSQEGK